MDATVISIIINVFLIIVSMIWVNFDFIRRYKEFWEAIKGEDRILQVTEVCIYIWVRILPIIILCDLFLDYEISDKAWYSLDAIFFALIAGDLGHKYIEKIKK